MLTDLKGETDQKEQQQTKNYCRGLEHPLTTMNRSSKQKVDKEISALNDTLQQRTYLIFTELYRIWQNTHSSQVHTKHSQEQTIC